MKEPITDLPEGNEITETMKEILRKELGTDFDDQALELL
jgi:hypothetical protein